MEGVAYLEGRLKSNKYGEAVQLLIMSSIKGV